MKEALGRHLGGWEVFALAAGAMISSGLFVLPGIAFGLTGPSVVLAYLLAAVLYFPALLAQIELSTAIPRSGGSYVFVERTLGAFAGTVAGFANWLSLALKSAFACVGIGGLVTLVWPNIGSGAVLAGACGACIFFTALNMASVKESARFQCYLLLFLILFLVAFLGFAAPRAESQRFIPFFTGGWESFLAVTGMVFVSFGGLSSVVDMAEEVREPRKTLPRGMVGAFVVVVLLYVAVVALVVSVMTAGKLTGSLAPVAEAARVVGGIPLEIAIAAAAFLAYATTGNAGIMSASRSPVAMSRDGLLPAFFAYTDPQHGTPRRAVALTGGVILLMLSLFSVENLVRTASTMLLLSFLLAHVAILVLRKLQLEGYQPALRCPGYPWLNLLCIAIYGFLIFEMGVLPVEEALAFLLVVALWYGLYVHRRIDRESGAAYLVRAALSQELPRGQLEDELMQICLAREGFVPDRFDHLVADCPILDIEEEIDGADMLHRLAALLGPRMHRDVEELHRAFLHREAESSTVVQAGLAIPHVVIPGSGLFDLVLVRCRTGAVFSPLNPPVRAVFALVGSADERNFHLKALVAIAHLVQEDDFWERWDRARNVEQLRDLVLLSRRSRSVS